MTRLESGPSWQGVGRRNANGPLERAVRKLVWAERLLGVGGDDADDAAATAGSEVDRAGRLREDRVVLADADADARLESGAALAHDDLAAGDGLAGEHLDAEALGVRVAAVAGGAEPLLVRHQPVPSSSVALLAAAALLAAPSLMLVISILVRSWRWPLRRLYPRFGLNFTTRSFGPRSCART